MAPDPRSHAFAVLVLATGATAQSPCPWEGCSPSPQDRYEAASAVVDGTLFVFGGFHGVHEHASWRTHAYDPSTDTWSDRADLPYPVTHAQAVVEGGRVHLVGGFVGDNPAPAVATAITYDVATDTWSQVLPDLPSPRAGAGIVLLEDRIHYLGGVLPNRVKTVADHWVLDLGDLAAGWDTTSYAPLPADRTHAAAVAMDGNIWFAGGQFGHDAYIDSVTGQTVYAVDTDLAHVYDPGANAWTPIAPTPTPRSHTEPGTFVHGGRIWLVGGHDSTAGKNTLPDITVYDPDLDLWSEEPPLPVSLLAPVARPFGDWLFVSTGAVVPQVPQTASYRRKLGPEAGCLDGAPAQLSLVSGGTQVLALDGGAANAGHLYLLLGSLSGSWPGVDLGTVLVPLNPDFYSKFLLTTPASASPLGSILGLLDGGGQASASFTLPPALPLALAGAVARHAWIGVDLAAFPPHASVASNALPVALVP